MSAVEAEVVIAGFGPTGMTAANLLGQAGIRTVVLERDAEPPGETRAIATDDEVLRIWQAVGLVDEILADGLVEAPVRYAGADGRTIGEVDFVLRRSPSGLPSFLCFHQPALDATLRAGVARFPSVEVRTGQEVTGFAQDADGVTVEARAVEGGEPVRVRARHLLGCDGGRSTIRKALGLDFEGETFPQPWLIVDARLASGRSQPRVDFTCDPRRPVVSVPMPGGRHRWEFMLHPGEHPAAFLLPEVAADLVAPLAPCPIEVERQVVYTFHDRTADRWRDGRVFLLGDAAHLMPPFAGQGLSAGVRDAGNLAWKVALAVRGGLPDAALDSYETERRPHAEAIMRLAVGLGSVIQTADPRRARVRDAVGRATQAVPPLAAWLRRLGIKPAATLRTGLLAGGRRRPLDAAGTLFPQPMVGTRSGGSARLDDVLGSGFAAVALGGDPRATLHPAATAALESVGARFVAVARPGDALPVGADGTEWAADGDGTLTRWFRRHRRAVAVIRPDRFVYGAFGSGGGAELTALLAAR